MTVKLYEENAYTARFEATVLSCEEGKKGFAVVLNRTAFFPEGGGQDADRGTLGDATVRDVQIKDGVITHTVDRALEVGATVTGAIDWETRFARMQQHTGEHLVSGLIHRTFGYDNVGFHMSDTIVTLDVSGPLTAEDITAIELSANRAVYENKAVTASFPTPEELDTIDYRSKLELSHGVRLVTIEDYDVCACCAPHVARTGEIGLIKLLSAIPYKGGTRIEMLSGLPAFLDYAALHESNREIMRLLSAKRDKTAEFVARDHDTIAQLRAENARLSEALALASFTQADTQKLPCGFTKGAAFDGMKQCLDTMGGEGAVFSDNGDGTFRYLLASETDDMRPLTKELNAALSGKGGGKPNLTQGSVQATKEDILAFLNA
ncbi:MAG: alanyl-tRNA editing protein [Clostridia bacterium]|nr:alanyl-tRNA editing protein [Clostridia bacterium]